MVEARTALVFQRVDNVRVHPGVGIVNTKTSGIKYGGGRNVTWSTGSDDDRSGNTSHCSGRGRGIYAASIMMENLSKKGRIVCFFLAFKHFQWRIQLGRERRDPSQCNLSFFIFVQFSAKSNRPNNRLAPPLGWTPLREILDPPQISICLCRFISH